MRLPDTIQKLLVFILVISGSIISKETFSQTRHQKELINPVHGKIMLIGEGEMLPNIKATFAFLAGEKTGRLVIITDSQKKSNKHIAQWEGLFMEVSVLSTSKNKEYIASEGAEILREATAVWIAAEVINSDLNISLKNELKSLLLRGGVIGGQGKDAEALATVVRRNNEFQSGLNILPNSYITTSEDEDKFAKSVSGVPGKVGWRIPSGAAIVIHNGREISVIGYNEITLRTAAHGAWPERVEKLGPPIDDLPYTADLISWNRSAVARLGDIFPPETAPDPEVKNGALLIIGGHGFPKGMWDLVVDYAGGTDANYVCFSQSSDCTGASKLRAKGCRNVSVHMIKTGVEGIGQGEDEKLLEDLKGADVVYFGGGRTYQYMDALEQTQAHELINDVLKRGGMILGSSAGAQIQGDFLVRGDPRTNNTLWLEGNDKGLGFLQGVIIDAHFRERGREDILPSLLLQHSQMLGIGIDETTAILVKGSIAEVIGPHTVTFYDSSTSKTTETNQEDHIKTVILMDGEKYDLKKRQKTE
ncbi:MAG: hypothetical protein C0593_06355 [Marinilabiliales bacterium]|nr:MAG: hypothetical protein C0593_06355 [Marinilabiliales bacterium]